MSTVEDLYNALDRSEKMTGGFTASASAEALDRSMAQGELARAVGIGKVNGKSTLLVVTNRRIIVEKIGLLGGRIEVPLGQVSAFAVHGLLGTINLSGAGYTLEIKQLTRVRAEQLAAAVRSGPTRSDAPVVPPRVAPATDDPIAKLRQLAELRDAGVLTAEEFEAKKAELLKQI